MSNKALLLQHRHIREDGKREGMVEGFAKGQEHATFQILTYLQAQKGAGEAVATQLAADIQAGKHAEPAPVEPVVEEPTP